MRRALDTLYDGCAWAAALCLVCLLGMVVTGILGGMFGFYVRGTDAYAGYFMAGASFLALAHTLRRGEHIRVTLILERLGGRWRRALELWCLAAAVVLALAFAWYAGKMVVWSYNFNDTSAAEDRTPLWIPQISMALGGLVLAVAFIDELVAVLRGREPVRATGDAPAHVE